jgi:PadR family transcriptional regulator, regulatory protein AphA
MPKVNKSRYAMLGVLANKPASGYDIKKFCDKSISHFWNENYGHIYPVLKELEREGCITSETVATDGKPPRTVYSITERGRSELAGWLLQPVEPSPTRNELLLKLIFAGNTPVQSMVDKVDAARQTHTEHLAEYKRIEAEYETNPALKNHPDYQYWMSALRYGMLDAQFRIKWCEETAERLRRGKQQE